MASRVTMAVIPGRLLMDALADRRVRRRETRAWWTGFAWGWVGATVVAVATMLVTGMKP